MLEKIEIIYSILGIIGAIIAFIKFALNPYIKRKEEFRIINNVINSSYYRWKELNFSVRGGTMIPHDIFLIVNKYRFKFKNQSKEMKAYLFRNAIQNGLGGDWGFWLDMNKDNENILMPLFLALDNPSEIRPAWRSAYILEKIFSKNIDKIDLFIDQSQINIINCKSMLDIVRKKTVEQEILRLSEKGTKEEQEKLKDVIEEIKIFIKMSYAFEKEQSII